MKRFIKLIAILLILLLANSPAIALNHSSKGTVARFTKEIPTFVEINYQVCIKGKENACQSGSITEFPPVEAIAIKSARLNTYFPVQSVLFIKSRGCAGTYYYPRSDDYYSTDRVVSGLGEEYSLSIVSVQEVPKESLNWRLKQERLMQKLGNQINPSFDIFKIFPCQSLSQIEQYERF